MAVEQAPLEALRHSVPAAEVDHVERAATADVRHGVPRKDIQARRASAQHALADLVGHFGGGDVNHTGEHARLDQLLHALSANTGGMEDKAVKVVLQALRHRLHAGGGNAKHG